MKFILLCYLAYANPNTADFVPSAAFLLHRPLVSGTRTLALSMEYGPSGQQEVYQTGLCWHRTFCYLGAWTKVNRSYSLGPGVTDNCWYKYCAGVTRTRDAKEGAGDQC